MKKNDLASKVRWFVVTNWNRSSKSDYEALINKGQVRFIAYGEEICPTTGKQHHQAYVMFWNPRAWTPKCLNKIGDMFGETHARVAPMFGNIKQNEAYCSKESELIKVGKEPAQGYRGDIQENVEMIMSHSIKVDDIMINDTAHYHQYARTYREIEELALQKNHRTEMTQGVYYYGGTGVGKSHRAFEGYSNETHYIKDVNEEYWNHYKQQETVIINEFRGQIRFSELLDLCDKWAKNVKIKCKRGVPFTSKKIIITSIMKPEDCYKNLDSNDTWDQFHRRFRVVNLSLLKEIEKGKKLKKCFFYGSA